MFKPAHYTPYLSGRYEVKAGLSALKKDVGNPQDAHVFQIDDQWPSYFQAKQQAREEDLQKYYLQSDFDQETYRAVINLILNQLGEEYPEAFKTFKEKDGTFTLECALNQAHARFDANYELIEVQPGSPGIARQYEDLFDFICAHIQEDVTLIKLDGGHDSVAALHLCFPNHWSAQDKIGKCFSGAHIPVPHMEKINKSIETLSQQLVHKGPFVRFAWGLATDARLNHHPQAPEGTDPVLWKGRCFDPAKPQLFVRVERQCIAGIPKADAYLFLIRSYHENVDTLNQEELAALHEAILSMDDETLKYKGLFQSKPDILDYLAQCMERQGKSE